VRVLARRHTARPRWLITAWAADGTAREVKVQVPDLGAVAVRALPEGAIFEGSLEPAAPRLRPFDVKR